MLIPDGKSNTITDKILDIPQPASDESFDLTNLYLQGRGL